MDILFQGSVAKHLDRPEDNEDAFFVAGDTGRIVLSDGASESYDGKNWARLLTEALARKAPSQELLNACQVTFGELHDPASMSWSKAAAFERGSFATALIAQEDLAEQTVTIQCVGDSCAVLTDGARLLETFPYHASEQFEGKPTLFSTLPQHNLNLLDSGAFSVPEVVWSYAETRPLFLLCLTDALGAWLLRNMEAGNSAALEILLAVRSNEELAELVEREREAKSMRRDDSTLVIALL